METFEKARLALRKHLLENKGRIAADLKNMRNKSEGYDIYNYIENLSDSLSFANVTSINEVSYEFDIIQDLDFYQYIDDKAAYVYSPPNLMEKDKLEKDSEILSESFF